MSESISKFYKAIINTGNFLSHFLLLAMRLYWGYAFFQAGFGKFGNIDKVAHFFASIDIPYPLLNAYLVAAFETAGGLCLLFGFAARLAAIPLSIIMITALFTAHSDALMNVFASPHKLIGEKPFNFLFTSLVIFCFGPGMISLDYLFKRFVFKSK